MHKTNGVPHAFVGTFLTFWGVLLLCGCQVTFSASGQAQGQSGDFVRSVYIPSAVDATPSGGLSWRLTQAVHLQAAQHLNLRLTNQRTARVGVSLEIAQTGWQVLEISECETSDSGEEGLRIGSGTYRCSELKYTLQQARAASEKELLSAEVKVRAIDLQTGRSLFSRSFTATSGPFDVVGDGTLTANLIDRPEFHTLRYLDNQDQARQRVAEQLAGQIVSLLLATSWPK